jgi:hypothetical protein
LSGARNLDFGQFPNAKVAAESRRLALSIDAIGSPIAVVGVWRNSRRVASA